MQTFADLGELSGRQVDALLLDLAALLLFVGTPLLRVSALAKGLDVSSPNAVTSQE